MTMNHKEIATIYKAFCDENRLVIIDHLSSGEHCACDLLEKLQISQSTLSHHMQVLIDSGIVASRRAGKWTYYSLDQSGSDKAVSELKTILTKKESTIVSCACEENNHEVRGN